MRDKQLPGEENAAAVRTAIAVEHVSKVYRLYDKPMDRLKEALRLTRKQKYCLISALTSGRGNVSELLEQMVRANPRS